MSSRRPSLPPLPDLSHLTEEERQIIEGVLLRQKEEEEKNVEIVKNLEKEVKQFEKQLDTQTHRVSSVGMESILPTPHSDNQESGPTCELCLKTKFADGLGNPCHYCKRRTCARCGGKVSMKPSKFVWSCKLCKKKQELLAKTGQWYHGTHANPVDIDIDSVELTSNQMGTMSSVVSSSSLSNQRSTDRPELQRENSKELKRQYSLSDGQAAQRSMSNLNNSQPKSDFHQQNIQNIDYSNNHNVSRQNHKRLPSIPPRSNYQQSASPMSLPVNEIHPTHRTRGQSEEDHRKYSSIYPIEPYDNVNYPKISETNSSYSDGNRDQRKSSFHRSYDPIYDQEYIQESAHFNSRRKKPENSNNSQMESYSYFNHSLSQENLPPKVPPRPIRSSHSGSQRQLPRITSDMIKGAQYSSNQRSRPNYSYMQYPPHSCSPPTRVQSSPRGMHFSSHDIYETSPRPSQQNHQSRQQRFHHGYRNDSMSSDPASEPNMIKRVASKTPPNEDCSTYSPYTDVPDYHNKYLNRYPQQSSYSSSDEDIQTSIDCTSCDDRDHDIDSMSERDYGVNSRYNQPRNPMPSSNYFNKQPVIWKMSKDKRYMIGHMVLQKTQIDNSSSNDAGSTILGLKVIGGKVTPSGRLGAFITKVKRGSIADIFGNLIAGDEVLEWNGRSFKNVTYEEVNDIILDSKFDPEVELIVRRYIELSPVATIDENSRYQKRVPAPCDDGFPKIQLKLFYSKPNRHLVVTLVQAACLQPSQMKPPNSLCSTFIKMYLLPDRNEQNYRRSRIVPNSNNPKWNQTFVFSPFKISEIRNLDLEIVVYDYDKEVDQVDVIGEIVIELGRATFQDIPCWYSLAMGDGPADESDVGDISSEGMYDPMRNINKEYWDPGNNEDRDCWDNTPVNSVSSPRRRNKDDNGNPRQYTDTKSIKDYESNSEILLTKTINHSGPYPDLKYDKRFQIPDEKSSVEIEKQMRRSTIKSPPRQVESDLLPTYSEEGPRRVSQKPRLSTTSNEVVFQSKDGRKKDSTYQNHKTEADDPRLLEDGFSETSEISEHSKNSLRSIQSENVVKSHNVTIRDNEVTPIQEMVCISPETRLDNVEVPQEKEASKSQSARKTSADQNSIRSDGSVSDSGMKVGRQFENPSTAQETTRRKRRPSIGQKFSTVLGFSRKSSSTSNLDKKPRSSFQRSEEVLPAHIRGDNRIPGSISNNKVSISRSQLDMESGNSNNEYVHEERIARKNVAESAKISTSDRNEAHVETFVEGLGPGQLVGRQVLGMPCLGEIQLSFIDRKGHLEVEVIRARNLVPKNSGKLLPQPYVKVHLIEDKISVEKQRTPISSRKTLDPLYQHQIFFSSSYKHKILQISVWGDHGRMEKKTFMGMCDVMLDDLNLKSIVFGWYKLFGMTASTAHHHTQKKSTNSPDN